MPLPVFFVGLGAAVLSGVTGAGAGAKGLYDQNQAKKLNQDSNSRMEQSAYRLDLARAQCQKTLQKLGEAKLFALNHSIRDFLDSFTRIKNMDFQQSAGMDELEKLHIDQADFEELRQMQHFAVTFLGSGVTGAAGGTLAALGAYNAALAFGTASTGTAISALSGAAATNATLAFLGGGSLAAGGMGMAGGAVVLGGLVAGPALLAMGIILGAQGGKVREQAKQNAAEAAEICHEMQAGTELCIQIRRRGDLFYGLLAQLEARFYPLIWAMQEIVEREGEDYVQFSPESKKTIAAAASLAVSMKAVLDTPILNEDGSLTEESEALAYHGA